MAITIHNLLVILAIVLFILAGFGVAARVQLGWFGLACFALATLVLT